VVYSCMISSVSTECECVCVHVCVRLCDIETYMASLRYNVRMLWNSCEAEL